jgi:hypothetical protein
MVLLANGEETPEEDRYLPVYSHDLGHDIVKEFMIPALTDALEYKRVTGDFSSAFLAAAAGGLGPFFLQGGRMYLITNGRFSEEDAKAIEEGTRKSLKTTFSEISTLWMILSQSSKENICVPLYGC